MPRRVAAPGAAASAGPGGSDDRAALARRTLLEGVGVEVADSFPGITRLGGQIVAALYLAEGACSMDELSAELGRSKSNIFANLRGLEAAGIVEHHREAGARHDRYRLRGKYPDVVIGAYIARLRRVVGDKRVLVRRAREILGDERTPEAEAVRAKLDALGATYDRFAELFEILPPMDGPLDLEAVINGLPRVVLDGIIAVLRRALGLAASLPRSGARRST
jgi:DNA-binding transcriptional regulator GbsR (MarR family)